jgi:anti-sigma factor RsiW
MSLSRQTMLELMAYADGELPSADHARIEQLLASNDEARRVVGAIGELSEWVDEAYEEPSAVLSNDIATVVMARVKSLPQTERVAPVVDLASVRRTRILAVAVAAVALAAGVMLYNRGEPRTAMGPDRATPPPIATLPATPPAPSAPPIEVAAAGGVDVEHVESPSHEVSVFYLPAVAAANASSVVVWIGDDDKGGH